MPTQTTRTSTAARLLDRQGPLLFSLAGILVTVGLFAAIHPLRHSVVLTANGDLSGLRHYIKGLGLGGALLLLALDTFHAIVPYPSEILTTTAGFVYGFAGGAALSILGWTLAALLSYGIGFTVGRPLLRRLMGRRFSDLERVIDRGGVQLLLIYRLVPVVPFALLGYVAGATRQPFWRFTWTSLVGYLPLTLAIAYLGSQAKSLSPSNPLIWAIVVFVIVLIVLSRFFAKRLDPDS